MKRILFLTISCLLLSSGIDAQVTIGSLQVPNKGALLDLKEKTDGTSDKGLSMPRVHLTNLTPTTDALLAASIGATGTWDKAAHIGLIVYNTNKQETANRICPGLHVWDGGKWSPIVAYPGWSIPPTVVGTPTVRVASRTPIIDPLRPIGHIGYLEDIRGVAPDWEYNRYAYARFHLDKIIIKTTTTYTGQDPFFCIDKTKTWVETVDVESIDDGVFMTQNMNTMYLPDNSIINGGIPAGTANPDIAEFSYPDLPFAGIQKTKYWDKSQGLLYNYKAAVNKDISGIDEKYVFHEVRQGICPTGWHVPSRLEYQAFMDAFPGNNNTRGSLIKSATYLAGSTIDPAGTSASSDMGGFNILLVGMGLNATSFHYGEQGYMKMSSSYNTTNTYSLNVRANIEGVPNYAIVPAYRHSVRCKKD